MRLPALSEPSLLLLLIALLQSGCRTPTPTPGPTPTPPPTLNALPREAGMKCDRRLTQPERISFTLWEHPALDPGPKGSLGTGVTGRDLAYVPECSPIRITRYAWSEADRDFYVYVQAPQGEGWVKLEFIELGQ